MQNENDMTKVWEGRRRAAARRRTRAAAEELAAVGDLWPPDARAVLTELGQRALQEIDRQESARP